MPACGALAIHAGLERAHKLDLGEMGDEIARQLQPRALWQPSHLL
jgi:hypothetical protein